MTVLEILRFSAVLAFLFFNAELVPGLPREVAEVSQRMLSVGVSHSYSYRDSDRYGGG